jgi:hypothetical protein
LLLRWWQSTRRLRAFIFFFFLSKHQSGSRVLLLFLEKKFCFAKLTAKKKVRIEASIAIELAFLVIFLRKALTSAQSVLENSEFFDAQKKKKKKKKKGRKEKKKKKLPFFFSN